MNNTLQAEPLATALQENKRLKQERDYERQRVRRHAQNVRCIRTEVVRASRWLKKAEQGAVEVIQSTSGQQKQKLDRICRFVRRAIVLVESAEWLADGGSWQ